MSPILVDLRSDTITQPTPAMRQAMAEARVGDDVLGDDPTVQELEERTARLLGKEAALFVPSGTMANQLAIRSQTQPGDELLLEANAHIYWYEAGASAALSGVICRFLHGTHGIFTAEDVVKALRPTNVHFAPTRLLAVENTHNRGGGAIWPLDTLLEVCRAAAEAGIRTHLDGARLWNASAATGVAEAEYARPFDSVSVCFSKGLGAPVGSALAGSRDMIDRTRRFRKQFGGGMRQVGIIAAGALHALTHHRARLADDHARARRLADGLRQLPDFTLVAPVATNMVYFGVPPGTAGDVAARLDAEGVRMLAESPHSIRAVTNLSVDDDGIDYAIRVLRSVLDRVTH